MEKTMEKYEITMRITVSANGEAEASRIAHMAIPEVNIEMVDEYTTNCKMVDRYCDQCQKPGGSFQVDDSWLCHECWKAVAK